jgi:hypothetical protein
MEEKKFLKNMWGNLKKFYDYLITFPERLYPFTEKVDNKKITGERAYKLVASRNKNLYGDVYSLQAPKLLLWRQVFHFLPSLFFVYGAHLLFVYFSFFNGFLFLGFYVFCIAAQEFYLHPHYYDQKPLKGVIDFVFWMIPVVIYALL